MPHIRTTGSVLALAAATALTVPAAAQAAEAFYGITDGNVLVSFQSDNLRNLDFERPVRGLPAGEQLVGLDIRPATGELYALGSTSRLYVINPRNGAARAIGAGPFAPPLAGAGFGFDFNPTVDRIRVVSDTDQNLRLNPADGAATNDTPLAYGGGMNDPAMGANPSVEASAYTNSVQGATMTVLYGVDNARGTLVTQTPANSGMLQTVGALGGTGNVVSFDIGTANAAFLARRTDSTVRLQSVNLATGAAADVGSDAAIATANPLRAIATAGDVSDDTASAVTSIALSSTQLDQTLLQKGVVPSVSCNEACTVTVTVRRGSREVGTATGEVLRRAGRVSVPVRLDNATRNAVRRSNVALSVRVVTTDGAGNDATFDRRVRSQTLAERRGS